MSDDEAFVARMSTGSRIGLIALPGTVAAILAVALVLFALERRLDSLLLSLLLLALCGALLWSTVRFIHNGGVVLRVDGRGILLGRLLSQFRAPQEVLVPWADIAAVVLFRVRVGALPGTGTTVRCIGLRLRAGVAPPRGEPGQNSYWHRAAQATQPPPAPVDMIRPISGVGRLDRDALIAAVAAYAPDVEVIDRDEPSGP